ncbi:hypothetical protein BLNAU_12547 [Blattamonas nauphoetae]|uniref:Uncharacterized protein n=1 Tax=Blattamonas nauphoetae TaxID=2049346 RepID=A0ABQ9XKA8_9EUKA|nr:hypothetical protein BLNAU_12547 [Blattamonas nauphoetae]
MTADLIPQLITTLNPHSLSFAKAVDIHVHLLNIIIHFLWSATRNGLASLKIEDPDVQQTVYETIFQQVLTPSEQYISHLCVKRFSIVDGEQSRYFMRLLAYLLRICPYHQPTMEFVLNMPVLLTIPSCLTFFTNDYSIDWFLYDMMKTQREWNKRRGDYRHMWKAVNRMLRMEGIEDVCEEKLQTDKEGLWGRAIVDDLIEWHKMLGMNTPRR